MASDEFYDFPGYMGWVPDTVDDKDYLYVSTFRVPWGSDENLRSAYQQFWIDIYNQGDTSSCTANAVAAGFAFELNRFKGIKAGDDNVFSPSRAFIYYNARKGEAEGQGDELIPDGGSAIRLAMRSLQKWGICSDVSWPLRTESVKWYPGPYPFYEAQRHMLRAYQYKRLDVKRWDNQRETIIKNNDTVTMDKDGDTLLNNLRSCISQGSPVVFGFRIFNVTKKNDNGKDVRVMDWRKRRNDPVTKWVLAGVPKGRRHLGPKLEENEGSEGHAVLAIGFKDGNKKERSGFILCQNSWGTDDKVQGAPYFWMPYNYITDFTATADFWMMDFSSFPSKL